MGRGVKRASAASEMTLILLAGAPSMAARSRLVLSLGTMMCSTARTARSIWP